MENRDDRQYRRLKDISHRHRGEEKPELTAVKQSLRRIAMTPDGQELEAYLMRVVISVLPPDVSDGAWREHEADRRFARNLLNFMSEPDGPEQPSKRRDDD